VILKHLPNTSWVIGAAGDDSSNGFLTIAMRRLFEGSRGVPGPQPSAWPYDIAQDPLEGSMSLAPLSYKLVIEAENTGDARCVLRCKVRFPTNY
jgi:hypothetical protein